LVQAVRHHCNFVSKILIEIGFKHSPTDPCLFLFKNATGMMLVIVHVANVGLACSSHALVEFLFDQLKKNNINCAVEHDLTDYFNCEILFNKSRTKAWLGRPHLIKKLLTLFADKISHLKNYPTPNTPGQTISRPQEGDPVLDEEMAASCRSGVGMLLHLLKHSCIDLGKLVQEMTKALKSPTLTAYTEMLRIIKFVLGTADMGLELVPAFTKGQLKWRLLAASDNNWVNDKDNRKSVMAFILFLCGISILRHSEQASIVALSTAEAEHIALSELAKEINFVVQILNSLGIPIETVITVHVDNMGAIFMAENATSNQRMHHIDVKHRFLVDLTEEGFLDVVFTN